MTIAPEEIAAFADGELDPQREAQVAAAVAADPGLAAQVRAHRELRQRLRQHFDPILAAPIPEWLAAPLRAPVQVADLAAAREKRQQRRTLPRWSWLAAPALAASIALAVILPARISDGYAEETLASALDRQLVAQQSRHEPVQILLSFRDEQGAYCRAFTGEARSGIACRDDDGWRLHASAPGDRRQESEFRMAGSSAELLEQAQSMTSGAALSAAEERAARARGWRGRP
jgi:hypothetical protein